ncbi:MAG: glycosyltransferase family 4 protein [Bacteroidales bacterium]|nr:glycosyltransferase family 4 protein [Bacteroidales bacterium]
MDAKEIKKILIITSEAFPYGMAGTNRIISLSKGFLANGIDVKVISMFKYGKPDNQISYIYEGTYEGIPYKNLLIPSGKISGRIIRVIKRKIKSILVFNFFLLNLRHGTFVLYYAPEMLPAVMIRILTKLRRSIFIKEETEHPSIRIKSRGKLYKYIYLKYYYGFFDGLFVITDMLHKYFRDELNFRKNIMLVPMIVDTDKFQPGESLNNKTIVFSGEYDVQKEGLDMLFGAFAKVLARYPDYKLNLYGQSKDQYHDDQIKRLILAKKFKNNLTLHGYKTRDELVSILKDAGIFVFTRPPSLQATYGFSTKLGEYLATGKPVIVTRVGEVERYLTDRENAFLCDPNETSVAEKIFEIIGDYTYAMKVGSRGRMCVLKHFNNKLEARKIIDTIQLNYN